ncbi:MAG: helix-turn-helix domain-containing protein [Sphingomonadaceae bacterium]|nr:helix-turn-helix domain-containing protein [Sphingomonadaceae bacterium]
MERDGLRARDWHPEDIKAAIRKRDVTLRQVAEAHLLHRQVISLALHRPHGPAERAIAKTLGLHPEVIWPSRYHPDGSRKSPQPRPRCGRRAGPQ